MTWSSTSARGDGRIPIHAGRHFGARAVGVELEGNLVQLSRNAAQAQGVSHLVQFVQQDLYEADISKASVIALYISPGVMDRLKPRLLALRPGTRVVSHHFTLGDWEPDETIRVEGRTAHLWIVPRRWRATGQSGCPEKTSGCASRGIIRRWKRPAKGREDRSS